MNVSVFGIGYVGLVQGAALAEVGHNVLCVDVDAAKVQALNDGSLPIYEPGLKSLVRDNHHSGRLQFGSDLAAAVNHGDVLLIAVGRLKKSGTQRPDAVISSTRARAAGENRASQRPPSEANDFCGAK